MKNAALTMLATLSFYSVFAQDIGILNDLEKGEYKVGFTHQTLFDYSRTFNPENEYRPIQLTIWYPASKEADGKPMSYKDYVQLFYTDSTKAVVDFKKDPLQYGASDTNLNQILHSKTLSINEAKPENGNFPLVLFVPGIYEKSYSNALLCEQLASNGYIVASTSYLGAYSSEVREAPRIPIEPQVRDMEFILAYMKNYKNANFDKIGVIGHSAGGSSALIMALRNSNIDAVAILDGSFIGNPGLNVLRDFNYFNPKYLNIPFLHFISGGWRKEGKVHQDFNNQFYDGLEKSEAYVLDMFDLLHQSFVSDMHLRFDNSGIDYKKMGINQSEEKTNKSYMVISKTILIYFNIYLKNDNNNFNTELKSLKIKNQDIFDYETNSTHNKK